MRPLTRRHKIALWSIGGLFLLYSLAGFVAAPMVIRNLLEKRVAGILQRQVAVAKVRVNPYTLSVRLAGLNIREGDGAPLLAAEDLVVNAELISVFKRALVIKSLDLNAPALHVVRISRERFNFSDLIPPPEPDKAQASGALRLVLKHLRLTRGTVEFADRAAAAPFTTTLASITINLQGLDTRPHAKPATFELSAATEAKETTRVEGRAGPVPMDLKAAIDLTGVVINKYSPYYQPYLEARVAGGLLGLAAVLHWTPQNRSLDGLQVKASDLRLVSGAGDDPLLTVPRFQVRGAHIDLSRRVIDLGRIDTHEGTVWSRRDGQGRINLLAAFLPASTTPSPATPDAGDRPASWQMKLPQLTLDGYRVNWEDRQPPQNAQITIDQISVALENLDTQPNTTGNASVQLRWAGQGRLALQGTLGISPLQADLTVDAHGLDIRPLQPYLSQHIRMLVTSGEFNSQGHLRLGAQDGARSQVQFGGQASLTAFQTVDPDQSRDFLKWKALFVNGLDMGVAPFYLSAEEVSLTDFFNRLIVSSDGTSNIQAILAPPKQAAAGGEHPGASTGQATVQPDKAQNPAAPATRIQIKTVSLQGGQIDFSDHHVKPNVHVTLNQVGGRISGLTSLKEKNADVALRGKSASNIPFEINGQINPLIAKPYVDLNLSFNSIDLSPFAPYSGKYLGYRLEKGQLSLSLSYRLADNKLAGENKIAISQLTFGETVNSPSATKLPIKLAVALLKDAKGDIDLDLPVQGDLNDPQFSVGGIVVKMFVNLIVDIVTSPFKFLGAVFGGGEELQFVDFQAGQSTVPPSGRAKLDTLVKILKERPGLKLEVQGQVDPHADSQGLRQERFEQALKAAMLQDMTRRGQRAVPLDQITLQADQKATLIARLFAASPIPRPRDEKGRIKKLDTAEMEKLLITAIAISPDDLRLLAHSRAKQAKDYLVEGGVPPERIFIIEPQTDKVAEKQKPHSRVRFSLK